MNMFGLTFRKEWGQNFLTDSTAVENIAEACGAGRPATVLEIGAGAGALTVELAKRYGNVVAVEIDRGLVPLLKYVLGSYGNVELVCGDIMKTDLEALLRPAFERGGVSVCANLPYYITTPILLALLDSRLPFESITVMIQSEVADRLVAAPGTSAYGSVTAYLGYFGVTHRLFEVTSDKFLPPPKVDSAFVCMPWRDQPAVQVGDEARFFRIVNAAFALRRKTLCNNLTSAFHLTREEALAWIARAGLPENIRGEALSLQQFADLANAE